MAVVVFIADPNVPEICKDPSDGGPCKGRVQKWYYNNYEEQCIGFMYVGCGGNENNFNSQVECENTCMSGKRDHKLVMQISH